MATLYLIARWLYSRYIQSDVDVSAHLYRNCAKPMCKKSRALVYNPAWEVPPEWLAQMLAERKQQKLKS